MKRIFIFLWVFGLFTTSLLAKEINFEISVNSTTISLGQRLQLNLAFNGTQNIPAFNLPDIDGFLSQYVGPSTSMSIINGQVSSSITHIYTLLPQKEGTFKIGPLHFSYKADTYISNTLTVTVASGGQVQTLTPNGSDRQPPDISDKIFLILQPKKNKVFLNEVVPVTIKLYVNKLGVRDIQFPVLTHEGFSLSEFSQPRQYQEVLGGIHYEVLEFNADFFGLNPGELHLGPVTLSCNLISKKQNRRSGSMDFDDVFNSDIFDDFFSSYLTQPLNLKSADIPITVVGLPEGEKPEGFTGAVGDFDFELALNPQEVKVGDPITLRAMVKGIGNLNTITIPQLETNQNFKVYEPQLKQEKESKTSEQVILPLHDKVTEIPKMVFSFFNPNTEKFKTIVKGPFTIKVTKPEQEEETKIVEPQTQNSPASVKEEKLGQDLVYIKTQIGRVTKRGDSLYRNKIFLWLQMVPLFCLLVFWFSKARSQKLKNDVRYARLLSAPRKARSGLEKAKGYLKREQKKEFYDTVFQTLQEYLGDRFHLPSQSITVSVIDEILSPKQIPEEILNKLKSIFKDCDMARYGASTAGLENMKTVFEKLEWSIDYFQKNRV